jgi:uncharacterized protein (DUF433 family)
MYDVVEAARLVQVSPDKIVRWSTSTTRRPALVPPSLEGMFSFHDLISLLVVAKLAERGVSSTTIASGIEALSRQLHTERPLAREELRDNLATVGRQFFARDSSVSEWIDVGKGRQGAFQEVIEPALRQIEYGSDHLASIWRPARRVWLNPKVQAGASCVDHTRIPTATIMQIVDSGDHPADVAADYDLELEDVMAALDYERGLRQAA